MCDVVVEVRRGAPERSALEVQVVSNQHRTGIRALTSIMCNNTEGELITIVGSPLQRAWLDGIDGISFLAHAKTFVRRGPWQHAGQ